MKMEEYNDTESVTVGEFKRLRNNLELAQKEITKLKQNDDEIKNSESVRASIAALTDARTNGLINENNELKVLVGCHRNALRKIADLDSVRQDESDWMAEEALAALPKPCLQSVKADAVKSFGHKIGLYDSEYDDQEYIEVSRDSIRDHIEQLRKGEVK